MFIQHIARNILEVASLSVAAGIENADAPLARLYDRHAGRRFETNQLPGTWDLTVQQTASALPIDALVIHRNHNLSGTVQVWTSADGATWGSVFMSAVATPGADVVLVKNDLSYGEPSPRVFPDTRWIRIRFPANCYMTEAWLGSRSQWEKNPSRPGSNEVPTPNVLHETTVYGSDRFMLLGPPRRGLDWQLDGITQAQRDELYDLATLYVKGYLPIWLRDYTGAWVYCLPQIELTEVAAGTWNARLRATEIVG
jgi:hypothetical protein